ncbi:hypothetical protein ACIBCT_35550 [Streptosporangium sp. NPDC050855]|uniref:hypothetical protein n=1 Tax=Streptosporangium sp. NPDC050855 TaxID=3366194 RepID=UPI0037A97D24
MKTGLLIAAATGALLGLASCATPQAATTEPNQTRVHTSWMSTTTDAAGTQNWGEHQVQLSDGWYVTCITYTGYREGSVSCDYGHPHPEVAR